MSAFFESFVKESVAGRPLGRTVKGKMQRQTLALTLKGIREGKAPESARVHLAMLRGGQAAGRRISGLGLQHHERERRALRAGDIVARAQVHRELSKPGLAQDAKKTLQGYLDFLSKRKP